VAVTIEAGRLQLVKDASGALTSFGAPEGFTVQVVRAPASTAASANFSAVVPSCQFPLSSAALNAQRQSVLRACTSCYRCLKALAFSCSDKSTSLYVRVRAKAKATRAYAASAWSAPLEVAVPCTSPAGVSCFV
jgi:hypothetical protein